MPGGNLTREEALRRSQLIEVDSYQIELDLTQEEESFGSITTVNFSCRAPGESTFVDLIAPSVQEIVFNGRQLEVDQAFDGTRITLDNLTEKNTLRVVASCAYMNTGEGLHRFVDPADDKVYLYTQFQVPDAQRVFANFDQPDLKASFSFTITAPAEWEVCSNSLPRPGSPPSLLGRGGSGRVREGVKEGVWRFEPTPRISTYVTAVVAGNYRVVRDVYRRGEVEIPVGLYCRASLFEHLDAEEIFSITKAGFDYFLENFGYPYPFKKYDQLFVPEFNAGAMENAGCITIRDEYVFRSRTIDARYERRAETILHEMAHMWFGDLVTMRWWDDLWLNESFATFASLLSQTEATRWRNAWATFANDRKAWAYAQDQLPSTHPIVADIRDLEDVEVNFDGITYAKGSSVLRQLVAWVGKENFLAGVRQYFKQHAWGNTQLSDLLTALEQTSGRNLSKWSAEWLEAAEVNTLRPQLQTDAEGKITSFTVLQEAPPAYPTLRSHRIAIGLYERGEDGLLRTGRLELDVSGAHTEVPQLIGRQQPDLILLNDDDLSYTKIRFDENSLQTLKEAIGEIQESLPRTLCWWTAWDMTRDAEMPAREYLALVLSGIAQESDIGVLQLLQQRATTAVDLFVSPNYRTAGRTTLADAALEFLLSAPPGSDHQLAWARTFASLASTADHLAVIRKLFEGSRVIKGLTLDPELRWALLLALVINGQADEADIVTELKHDSTAVGERQAATCLAARPSRAAKEEAWASIVESNHLSNAMLLATIDGFSQPTQRELLAPFTERYFSAINKIWHERTNKTAQKIVRGLYPRLLIEQATLEQTDAFLRDSQPVPALRRLILEARDGVSRALRAQACDQAMVT